MKTVGFIGTGNMGGALARAVSRTGAAQIFLYDKSGSAAQNMARETGGDVAEMNGIARRCDYIFLGVKPNIITQVVQELRAELRDRRGYTLISMAAGVSIEKLEEALGFKAPIIRIMPNTPVSCGEGMILWCSNDEVSVSAEEGFLEILSKAGKTDRLEERLIDAASAISGCGPAFAYMFIEALADGGVECGLPRDKALMYAEQMLLGSAKCALEYEKNPAALKDAVCSPGGTTIAGVHALESGAFRASVMNAVVTAYEKTLKIGK